MNTALLLVSSVKESCGLDATNPIEYNLSSQGEPWYSIRFPHQPERGDRRSACLSFLEMHILSLRRHSEKSKTLVASWELGMTSNPSTSTAATMQRFRRPLKGEDTRQQHCSKAEDQVCSSQQTGEG